MKKIISLFLLISLLSVSICPAFANTNDSALQLSDSVSLKGYQKGLTSNGYQETFDLVVDGQTSNYKITRTNDNQLNAVITEDGVEKTISYEIGSDTILLNNERVNVSDIVTTSTEFDSRELATTPQISRSFGNNFSTAYRSYNGVEDPSNLIYRYLSTTKQHINVGAIKSTLRTVGYVCGLVLVLLVPPAGYVLTGTGVAAYKITAIIGLTCQVSGDQLSDKDHIYFKKRQYVSTRKAKIQVIGGEGYVYKDSVKYYHDSSYSNSASSWLVAGYFYASRPW